MLVKGAPCDFLYMNFIKYFYTIIVLFEIHKCVTFLHIINVDGSSSVILNWLIDSLLKWSATT